MIFHARLISFDSIVRFRAERDLPDAIRQAARRRRTTSSEFIRQTIRAQIQRDGIALLDETLPLFSSNGEGA
jgi:hypothetical protein